MLYLLNRDSINKVQRALKCTYTEGTIVRIFQEVISILQARRDPVPPVWKKNEIGRLGKEAWEDQRRIGWMNMLKGRLSWKQEEIQELFYRGYPDYQHQKMHTGIGWKIRMIKELTSMLLVTWTSHCGCLDGHTKTENKQRRGDEMGATVRKCYGRRGEVVTEHQQIFDQPVEDGDGEDQVLPLLPICFIL